MKIDENKEEFKLICIDKELKYIVNNMIKRMYGYKFDYDQKEKLCFLAESISDDVSKMWGDETYKRICKDAKSSLEILDRFYERLSEDVDAFSKNYIH